MSGCALSTLAPVTRMVTGLIGGFWKTSPILPLQELCEVPHFTATCHEASIFKASGAFAS